ncbi:MAG: hypothetical protein JOZ32_18755, partial [Bryobacterales bacterium]|nr:hypothetical protein [Bryobacterales bacterium]
MPNTSFFKDLHYAARVLRRSPGFTVLAMLAMGLGIGINTAVFTAYRAIVARPLDGHNEREMVNIALLGDSGAVNYNFSFPDYEAYRDS